MSMSINKRFSLALPEPKREDNKPQLRDMAKPIGSKEASGDSFSISLPDGALESIFQEPPLPTTPTFHQKPETADAALRVANFLSSNPEYMDKPQGVSAWTVTELANGTGRFTSAPEQLREDAKRIINTPGFFHELDLLDSDGKLYADNQDGYFNPNYVRTPFHTPVYM